MNVQNCLLNILHHYGINVYITNEKRDRFSLFFCFILFMLKVIGIDLTLHLLIYCSVHFSAGTALTVFNKYIPLYLYRYAGKKQMFV